VQVALVDRLERQSELWEGERAAIEALLVGDDPLVRSRLLELVAEHRDTTLLAPVHALLRDPDDLVRDAAVHCVMELGRPESVAPLIAAAQAETDDFLRVAIGEALALLGSEAAFEVLLDVMESGQPELVRADAFERLGRHWPGAGGPAADAFDPAADADARAAAIERLRRALAAAG
jgi:HEAT repeat protein